MINLRKIPTQFTQSKHLKIFFHKCSAILMQNITILYKRDLHSSSLQYYHTFTASPPLIYTTFKS